MQQPITREGFDRLSERSGELLDRFEEHPDAAVREDFFELLENIDTLHREALVRILRLVREVDPTLRRLAGDPIVRTVLSLYDLLPDEDPEPRPKNSGAEVIPLIEVRSAAKQPSAGSIPLIPTRPRERQLKAPVFVHALALDALVDGAMQSLELDGTRVLLIRLGSEVSAFRNACAGSVLPLDLGRLDGAIIVCPWHECRYDARTGRRMDGGEGRLVVIPVSISNGEVRLAVGVA
ncbi:MAG: Rieske (2Fe-2S) protein [Dehalococcoidia bacterium]